jgi:nucleotidyltransferase/DNA polymerase involved in DNA repair
MIACVFLPDLFSDVATQNNDVLLLNPSGFVQAASRGAVRRGVRVGMRAQQAHALCPDAHVQAFDASPLEETGEAIETELSAFTTRIEAVWGFGHVGKKKRLDETLLPASAAAYCLDLGKLRGSDAVGLARQMQRILRDNLGLCSSVGLARGKYPALVAARVTQANYPKLIAPGEEAAFLAPFSIYILPLDRETGRRLERFSIRTVGAFAALPGAAVLSQFGKAGRLCHQLARGQDTRPVTSRSRKPSERLCELFDSVVDNQLILQAVLERIGCDFEQRLAVQGLMTGKLELVLHLDNGKTLKARRVLRENLQNGRLIGHQLIRLLSQCSLPCGVVGVEAIAHDLVLPAMQQLDLFEQSTPTQRLSDLLDTLAYRFGSEHVYAVTDLDPEHWLPERRYALESVEAA